MSTHTRALCSRGRDPRYFEGRHRTASGLFMLPIRKAAVGRMSKLRFRVLMRRCWCLTSWRSGHVGDGQAQSKKWENERLSRDHEESVAAAVQCYNDALMVCARAGDPSTWAGTIYNMMTLHYYAGNACAALEMAEELHAALSDVRHGCVQPPSSGGRGQPRSAEGAGGALPPGAPERAASLRRAACRSHRE